MRFVFPNLKSPKQLITTITHPTRPPIIIPQSNIQIIVFIVCQVPTEFSKAARIITNGFYLFFPRRFSKPQILIQPPPPPTLCPLALLVTLTTFLFYVRHCSGFDDLFFCFLIFIAFLQCSITNKLLKYSSVRVIGTSV